MKVPLLLKQNLRAGDLLLSKPVNFDNWHGFNKGRINLISKAIFKAQVAMGFGVVDAQYTHSMVAGFGIYTASAEWPTVKMVNLQEQYVNAGHVMKIYRYNKWSSHNDISDRARFVAYCFADNNMPYDWLGLFGFLGRLVYAKQRLHLKNSVFCSEQVMRGLLSAGVDYYLSLARQLHDYKIPYTESSPDLFSPAHISYGCRMNDDWEDVTWDCLSAEQYIEI